jgi:hypothetical protein
MEQGELRMYLPGAEMGGVWSARGAIRIRTAADGRVTAMAIPDPGAWAGRRNALADLVAQTLGVHRDEAVDALNRIDL